MCYNYCMYIDTIVLYLYTVHSDICNTVPIRDLIDSRTEFGSTSKSLSWPSSESSLLYPSLSSRYKLNFCCL